MLRAAICIVCNGVCARAGGDAPCPVPDQPRGFSFAADARTYHVDVPSISVFAIRQMIGTSASNQCFLERAGDEPDEPVSDNTSFDLRAGKPSLYFVPPATGG